MREYKEFVALLIAIAGAALFVVDYFATKKDVRVLHCQMRNNLAIVESRLDADRVRAQIQAVSLERTQLLSQAPTSEPERARRDLAVLALAEKLKALSVELDKILSVEQEAARILRFGLCDEPDAKK